MSISNIPADMWGTLIRIEGTTARSEAKIDALDVKLNGVINDVNQLKSEHDIIRGQVDAIIAERKIQVPEFDALKASVQKIDSWRTGQTAKQEQTSKVMTWLTGLIGAQAVGFFGYLIVGYMTAPAEPVQPVQPVVAIENHQRR